MRINVIIDKFKVFLISSLLILIMDINGLCQEFSFREYGVKDGLPQSEGTMMYQDSRGFIWISTRNGLARFDGIDFITYYKKDGLPSNFILRLFEDGAKDLWALSREGLSKYTGDGFIFYPPGPEFQRKFFLTEVTATKQPDKIFIIAYNKDNFTNEVILFENGRYSTYSSDHHSLDKLRFGSIGYDTTQSELLLLDLSKQLWSYKNETLTQLSPREFSELHYDRDKILIKSNDTIFEYLKRNFYPHPFENKTGRAEVQFLKSYQNDFIKYFDGTESINIKLPFKSINAYIDKDRSLWFPSENNVYRLMSTVFTSLAKDLIKTPNIWTICMDKYGNLWLGSLFGELLEYDGTMIRHRNEYKKLFTGSVGFFKGSRLLSNGEMWLSLNKGVLIWDGSAFSRLKGIPENTQVCYIYEDPYNHKVIIGTDKGLFIAEHGVCKSFKQFTDNDLGVIEGVARDDSGFYWLSGHHGIIKFDGIKAVQIKEETLPSTLTYNIEKDDWGGIWVSSDDGLFYKRRSDKHFGYGLPLSFNMPANALKIMDKSHLLVGRAADICLIDLDKFYNNEKNYYRIYDKTDGYPGDDCLDNGIIKANNGTFWILTSDNVVKFNTDRLRKNIVPPRIYFTGLFYETDSMTWKLACNDEFYFRIPSDISFSRHHNKIKITFTGISTENPDKVQYIYKLEGLNNKWSLPSNKREIIYENLLPGKYTFHLKSFNADGVQNSESKDLKFSIKPAVWETTIFRITFVLILVVIPFLITKYIMKRNQERNEEKQSVRSELLRLQVNSVLREFDPHFIFNAINSVGSLIMTNNREEAYSYLTMLSAMLRAILSDGSSILKSLSEEIDFISHYCEFQKLRFGERFSYSINIGEDVNLQKEVPKMTIQTFVENAVKHGFQNRKEGGIINILLTHRADYIEIIIKDNGIGRDASVKMQTEGTGYGIKTISRIFEIINQENYQKSSFQIRDLLDGESSLGTEVIIVIPDSYNFRTKGLHNDYAVN